LGKFDEKGNMMFKEGGNGGVGGQLKNNNLNKGTSSF
jgi:hypothetical protein